ncbi:oxidoreductase [Actinorhabdospora filicis]|uniref:Oxidoreductase n=1 Tax=Actinorhabdospora filicis TaxID=1785913 RepID=A0A9W6WAP8_9ACTN|nr:aldo/keto reductase [Actinorhabdospora filicis]GLZ78816.1 oxidoreductase [Actinorhabdospora filicis]
MRFSEMPRIGLGTSQLHGDELARVLAAGFEAGYRWVDTAARYGNEAGVGAAVRASGLPREDVWVTTKVWNDHHGYEAVLADFGTSMRELGLERVDLYLIHWPVASRDLYAESWRALLRLREEGLVDHIGVSNFQIPHLERLFAETGVYPLVNQVEAHPFLGQVPLRAFHAAHGIQTQAWSALNKGRGLDDPVITGIAGEIGASPAQVVLAWHLARGTRPITKSGKPERLAAGIAALDLRLSDAQVAAIDALDRGERGGPDPDTMELMEASR